MQSDREVRLLVKQKLIHMDILIKIVQLLASLSILVLIHECGHFVAAKIFKVRVEKFYLFFNPWFSLFKFKPKIATLNMV